MKKVELIHNPRAGNGTFTKARLMKLLRSKGFNCRYFSTKEKGWENFANNSDIIVAGGDGAVRKTAAEILKRKLLHRPASISVFPLGTANNIARSLGIKSDAKSFPSLWKHTINFDVGRLYGVPGEKFFLESFGLGLFPWLMHRMRKYGREEIKSAEERMQKALELLTELVQGAEPIVCSIEVDRKKYSGKYLMVEVMNTPRLGPNLLLSPDSSTSDGEFEVVLLEEKNRDAFHKRVLVKSRGEKKFPMLKTVRGKNISIQCAETCMHADDQLLEVEEHRKIRIHAKKGLLNFWAPQKG